MSGQAMAKNPKNPPQFISGKYQQWKNEMAVWELLGAVEKKKQGPLVALSLTDKARECAMMIPADKLGSDQGLAEVIKQLDKLFAGDQIQATFNAIEELESYKRSPDTPISEYITEFGRLNDKVKGLLQGRDTYAEEIMAQKLLKQANLSEFHQQLVRATMKSMKYEHMVNSLKRVFGEGSPGIGETSIYKNVQVKSEPTYYQRSHQRQEDFTSSDSDQETYYNTQANRKSSYYSHKNRNDYNSGKQKYNGSYHKGNNYNQRYDNHKGNNSGYQERSVQEHRACRGLHHV